MSAYLRDMFTNAKRQRQDRKNRMVAEESFTFEYVLDLLRKQNYRCAVTGKELTFHCDHDGTNVSIDRIDSTKPYGAGNVRLVCAAVNIMKHRMTDEQLGQWCMDIAKGMGLWK
jgi:hypothetical protein